MADELAQLRQDIERFPQLVTERLRAVAWRKAREVKDRARVLAPRDGSEKRGTKTKGRPHLADSIVIIEDAENKQFLVRPETPWLPNLGMWKERGTVHTRATPFMRPAGDAVVSSFRSEMVAAATTVANEVFR